MVLYLSDILNKQQNLYTCQRGVKIKYHFVDLYLRARQKKQPENMKNSYGLAQTIWLAVIVVRLVKPFRFFSVPLLTCSIMWRYDLTRDHDGKERGTAEECSHTQDNHMCGHASLGCSLTLQAHKQEGVQLVQ